MSIISGLDQNPTKILIVEDDSDVADLVSVILRRRRFETIIANDGEAGLASAIRNRPDGILLDLNMPQMGGFAFLKFRAHFEELKATPIIVLTASRQLEDVERAMSMGAVGYVAKPVQISALLERLEKHIPSPLVAPWQTTVVSWATQAKAARRQS